MFRSLFAKKFFVASTTLAVGISFSDKLFSRIYALDSLSSFDEFFAENFLLNNWHAIEEKAANLLESDPENVKLLLIYAIMLHNQGKFNEVEAIEKKLENKTVLTPEETYLLAEFEFASGNYEDGLKELKNAAQAGYPVAQWKYGATLMNQGHEQEAYDLVRKAAKSGAKSAKLALALFYYSAKDPDLQDQWKAEQIFSDLVKSGYAPAYQGFGVLNLEKGKQAEGLKYLKLACDSGDTQAQVIYGQMCFGMGKAEEGFKIVEKAYQSGSVPAIPVYALAHIQGVGVPVDIKRGFDILKHGISVANTDSMKVVGVSSITGDLITQNYKYAHSLFDFCANQLGDADCLYYLAQMHLHGVGVEKDVEHGKKILKEAVDMNHKVAKELWDGNQFNLYPEEWVPQRYSQGDEEEEQ